MRHGSCILIKEIAAWKSQMRVQRIGIQQTKALSENLPLRGGGEVEVVESLRDRFRAF